MKPPADHNAEDDNKNNSKEDISVDLIFYLSEVRHTLKNSIYNSNEYKNTDDILSEIRKGI